MSEKVVLVTGAARGIGLGIAECFAESGYYVVLSDINQKAVENSTTVLRDKGLLVQSMVCDVTDEDMVESVIQSVVDQHGRIDVLVNNAGMQYVSVLEDFPTATFRTMTELMLIAPFVLTKLVFPIMKQQQFGRIINISSINGVIGFAGKSAYNSAKHGIIGLTKVTALEGAEWGITANAICPGYVDTELVRGQFEDLAKTRGCSPDKILEEVIFPLVPQKRLIDLSEVSSMAVYLAGEKASGITGQNLVIDGGYTTQ